MSGLGYSQFRAYFAGEATLAEIVERIKLDTHAFIRRQYAWFHPLAENIRWLDSPEDAVALVQNFLQAT